MGDVRVPKPSSVCFWCEHLIDADENGWHVDGDYGCETHPISTHEGVGPHETRVRIRAIVRDWHRIKELDEERVEADMREIRERYQCHQA